MAEQADILVAIESLRGDIKGVNASIAGLDSRLEHMEHNVVGNGKEGLLTRVDRVEIAQKNGFSLRKDWKLVAIIVVLILGGEEGKRLVLQYLGSSIQTPDKNPPTQVDKDEA